MHQTGRRLTWRGSGRSVFYTPYLSHPYKTGGEHGKGRRGARGNSSALCGAGREMTQTMRKTAPLRV